MPDDHAVGAANHRIGRDVIRERVHHDHRRSVRVVGDDVALVGHFTVVLKGPAAAEDALGIVQPQDGEDRRERVHEQIGGRTPGIIPVQPPLKKPRDAEVDLRRVAEKTLPKQLGAGLGAGVGNLHPLTPVTPPGERTLYVHRLADDPLGDHLPHHGVILVGYELRADLNQAIILLGRLFDLLGQLELRPVRQRLLAVDVLVRIQCVDRLRCMETVGRGDADHVDRGVGQQILVLHVLLRPAGILAGGFQTRPIDVANGHRLGNTALLELVDDAHVFMGASAGTDEPDADPLVGALGTLGEHTGRGKHRCGYGGRRRGGAAEEFSTCAVL